MAMSLAAKQLMWTKKGTDDLRLEDVEQQPEVQLQCLTPAGASVFQDLAIGHVGVLFL